jgi:hypothetical protein
MPKTEPSEFFKLTLAAAADWTRYTDPKVFGVFVFLGIGASDLLDKASALIDAHAAGGLVAWVATLCFWLACACGVLTVFCASKALFPHTTAHATEGKLYFGHIATNYATAAEYEAAVKAAADLDTEIAAQAWELSRIALVKVTWAQHAYRAVVGFLAFWAIGRIALELI